MQVSRSCSERADRRGVVADGFRGVGGAALDARFGRRLFGFCFGGESLLVFPQTRRADDDLADQVGAGAAADHFCAVPAMFFGEFFGLVLFVARGAGDGVADQIGFGLAADGFAATFTLFGWVPGGVICLVTRGAGNGVADQVRACAGRDGLAASLAGFVGEL